MMTEEIICRDVKMSVERMFVAVASTDGLLVNAHLGLARMLWIYEKTSLGFKLVERRTTPDVGSGDLRWTLLAGILKDCKALLVNDIGGNPASILKSSGIKIIQMAGLIDEGLDSFYNEVDEIR